MGRRSAESLGPGWLVGGAPSFYAPLAYFSVRCFSNDFFRMSYLFLRFTFSFFLFSMHIGFCNFLFRLLSTQIGVVWDRFFSGDTGSLHLFWVGFFRREGPRRSVRRDRAGCGVWRGHSTLRDFRWLRFGLCTWSGGFGRQGLELIEIERDFAAVDRFVFDSALVYKPEEEGDDAKMQQERKEKGERQPTNALLLHRDVPSVLPFGLNVFLRLASPILWKILRKAQ